MSLFNVNIIMGSLCSRTKEQYKPNIQKIQYTLDKGDVNHLNHKDMNYVHKHRNEFNIHPLVLNWIVNTIYNMKKEERELCRYRNTNNTN
jgi:hypothetical protein